MSRRNPTWRFAPNMGGAEQGNNPGQQHFARMALAAMVRETIQNSLDHHDNGLPPVKVSYQVINVRSEDVKAQELSEHVQACLEEIRDEPETKELHQQMLQLLQNRNIPCLAVIDSNTTGLQGENWDNLILREGIPTPVEGNTKGGSFGFGKNAPFNLAGAGAVIYSTRYLDIQNRKGKVEQMAGRSQLRTHTTAGERKQGTGFLAIHASGEWNQPLRGPQIPETFRLREQGTGVFILGFQPESSPQWKQEVIQAAVTQFFAAIFRKQLTVQVEGSIIDHQTLDDEIQALPSNDPTRHYRLAIDEEPKETISSGRLGGTGPIRVWILASQSAPRRLAHINRRGMLITSSKELDENPLCPQRTGQWSSWCCVTMAAGEETDAILRRMEPPAHDALRPGQLRDPSSGEEAKRDLAEHRSQIREFLKETLDEANRRDVDNVDELAKLFPLTRRTKGRDLEYRERKLQTSSDQPIEIEEPGTDPRGIEPNPSGREGRDKTDGESGKSSAGTGDRHVAARLRNTRIVRSSPKDLIMAFTMPRDAGRVRYGLRAAGEQYQRNEKPIAIQEVAETGDLTASAWIEDGDIVVDAIPNTRVTLMINLSHEDQDYLSYRLAVAGSDI